VIRFRPFRNTDPPVVADMWNDSLSQRGAFRLRNATLLEYCIFAKPYFDPNGLVIAEDDGHPVGFVHAGFGPTASESDLAFDAGVVCAIAVRPSHRRQKIGGGLLRHAEEYLGGLGAAQLVAGGLRPLNPFYFGLYGGSDSPGFLASDEAAAPFFEHHGYRCATTTIILGRKLDGYQAPVDPRFIALRRRYDVQLVPQPEIGSWWQECVMGVFDPVEFRLVDKLSTIPAARTLVWEMSAGRQPGNSAAGVLDVQVRPDVRRQGLARFLVNQMLRYVQDQHFRSAEVHVPELNQPALALFKGLGFEQIDIGRNYRKG